MDEESGVPTKESKAIISPTVKRTAALGFLSLGAIYGDISTSPLYVFSSILEKSNPSREDIYGAVSSIFWLFVIEVIFKYCLIVLYFGPNNNEGGQVAIYAKIAHHLCIGPKGVDLGTTNDLLSFTRSEAHDAYNLNMNDLSDNEESNISFFKKLSTSVSLKDGRFNKSLVEKYLSKFILGCCFIGCSLVISDGLLTPTTSVLSAVAGIAIPVPTLADKVMPISCGILIALFAIQRFGSGKISLVFSPVIFIWIILLLFCGIYNIAKYSPGIFAAMSPHYAINFLHINGIQKLGGVMLAITGCEAMFADIGHFSRASIQITLGFFVFPCLMLHYLGQAAFLIHNPQSISNVFYLSIPFGNGGGFYWFIFVISTLATIIASQALILSVFSILRQMIHIDCFPSFKVKHTSSKHFGQVYIPAINFILMVAVVLTTVGFKNSNNVTAAYGLGITLDFFVTTSLITLCLLYVYKVPIYVAIAFFLPFGTMDLLLIIAAVQKVPQGAWFPLVVTGGMSSFILFWRWCRSLKVNQQYRDRIRIEDLFSKAGSYVTFNGNNNEEIDYADPPINRAINFVDGSEMPNKCLFASLEGENYICNNVHDTSLDSFVDPRYRVKFSDAISYPYLRYKGIGVMYSDITHTLNSSSMVPSLLGKILKCFPALPAKFVFLSIRVTSDPYVKRENHIILEKIKKAGEFNGFYRCVVNFGFMDKLRIKNSTIKILMEVMEAEDIDEEITAFNKASKNRDAYDEKMHISDYEDTDLDTRVIHFVDNSVTKVRNTMDPYDDKIARRKIKSYLAAIEYNVKKFFVEQLFDSLNGLFGGLENIIELRQNSEIFFVGDKVFV